MPGPDMEFTLAEVDAAERAAGRRPLPGPAPTGPDMVFTESEVAATAPSTLTTEERDRARGPTATSAERAAALVPSTGPTVSDVATGIGVVNDGVSVVTAMPGLSENPVAGRIGGGFSAVSGIAGMVNAADTMADEDATEADMRRAGYGGLVGALDTASGVEGMLGNGPASDALGVLSGTAEVVGGIDECTASDGDAGAGGQAILHGGLSAASSAASLAGSPAAPVLASGAVGVAAGTALQTHADREALEEGTYMETRYTRGIDGIPEEYAVSASEEASIRGMEDRQWLIDHGAPELVGDIGGGISTIGRSWYNGLASLW